MKLKYIVLSIFCFCSVALAAQDKTLTVLHTSDAHSQIYPFNPNLADTVKAGRGGFIRRVNMIKEERAKDSDLLLLDCGDFSQGSPYYTMFKGDVEVELMNKMKYDAATLGNHEFDYGMDNMVRLFKMAKFPLVCSNYDFTGTKLEGLVKPYTIIKRKGVKIGIYGLSPKLEGLVFREAYDGIKHLDPAETAKKMEAFLKNEKKCDVIICLSHLGWKIGGQDDQYTFSKSSYTDLVLGGHSHTYLKEVGKIENSEGKMIPVDHNGKSAIYVGKLLINLNKGKK